MSSLLQCVDSRAYILVHIVGPLAATVTVKYFGNVVKFGYSRFSLPDDFD